MTRLEKALAKLAGCDYDALYISSEINQRYVTEFAFTDGYVLITKEKSYVVTDFRYIEAAREKVKGNFEIIGERRADTLSSLCAENHVKALGFEDSSLSYAGYESLKNQLSGVKLVPAGRFIEELRIFKDKEEVENITKAQRIAEKAFAETIPYIKAGVLETELAAELEYRMRMNGAEDKSFETICISGKASSSPHGVPRNVPIEHGFLTFDFGALYNGYHSDMTRTVVVGKADEDMKKLYYTVLNAQMSVISVIAEGCANAEMDKIARDIIDGAGYAGCFGHSLGHGVGLEIHEAPGLASRAEGTLKVGQIVTVEPGIYLEGKYGCRIEDMVEITPGGSNLITDCPKELFEIDV